MTSESTTAETEAREQVPEGLELIQSFVNTLDVESGSDLLASPQPLSAWLVERGLLARDHQLARSDVAKVIEVRDALRALLEANHGDPLDPAAVETLNQAVAAAPFVFHLDPDGQARIHPEAEGVDRAVGLLLGTVYSSMVRGTWERLKVCRSDTCRWAFYDHSKNRSGKWCSMAVCGNRAKARSYRRRQAADG